MNVLKQYQKYNIMFFKKLFSRSNLEFKEDDGGRAAAGYTGIAGDCVV